ncbi:MULTISPECIES: DUF4856 domain-containing protein [Pseudoalteromonas]|uniref:Cadherin domain-containing protein n=1 Tax=Pseudoalteromonas luteoviolacea (strain 2ta16) TaxID=1353533 RepID=V4I104_PSEL2|nr:MULTISPECIES: DUF4856 domain-containing protein [Pseudoalteromonas]ESP93894.1 hypothetical protein PL2TA16_02801 [Pseudoalteromonas luteoviolacea 2ta16]KZN31327.1 hypothetical protein N483_05755 [Pseudoalteromonas luteoviolacea NCIMB 1944]MCG7548254.1 DUF4856 domain-containing protein [Pseudoalteromonas sp. Of7M-16]
MALRKSLLATAILAATVGLTGCGGSSSDNNTVTTPDTPTPPANKAPTITAENATVKEDTLGAEVTGVVFADDSDDAAALTFAVSDGRFEVVEGKLKLKDANTLNYEQEAEQKVTVTVTATDSAGEKVEQAVEVSIEDIAAEAGVNVYEFKNGSGESSVAYSGQVSRQAAISEAKKLLGTLKTGTDGINDVEELKTIVANVRGFLFPVDDSRQETTLTFLSGKNTKQATLGQISSLKKVAGEGGKIAGRDATYMNKDWQAEGSLVGWSEFGGNPSTPEGLVLYYLDLIDAQITQFENGEQLSATHNGTTVNLNSLYITPEGLDIVQLLQKHLNGAVALSQGADDYLDELLIGEKSADNKALAEGKSYTELEHKFDEGYGYFGAATHYLEFSDEQISSSAAQDSDGNGVFDLLTEYNFGNSTNASKRDKGTAGNTYPTDFSGAAQIAFIKGRKLINDKVGMNVSEWTEDEQKAIEMYRDQALLNWEKSIAATVIHYINYTIAKDDGNLTMIKSGEFDAGNFEKLAKYWGEMKGFALNFQFNPHSPFTAEKFAEMHTLMGNAPKLNADDVDNYIKDLEKARDIIAEVYGFDAENVEKW